MSIYKKGKECLSWFTNNRCVKQQSEKAGNGLCDDCEKERRAGIDKQFQSLLKS